MPFISGNIMPRNGPSCGVTECGGDSVPAAIVYTAKLMACKDLKHALVLAPNVCRGPNHKACTGPRHRAFTGGPNHTHQKTCTGPGPKKYAEVLTVKHAQVLGIEHSQGVPTTQTNNNKNMHWSWPKKYAEVPTIKHAQVLRIANSLWVPTTHTQKKACTGPGPKGMPRS